MLRRIVHALDHHGAPGLLRHILRGGRSPQMRRAEQPVVPHPFDSRHNTETGGYIPGQLLRAGPGTGARMAGFYNSAYYAIAPSALRSALALLPGSLAQSTFVDLGCGKGRALLVAERFPFASVLGVELDPGLCRIARTNTAGKPGIHVLEGDAAMVRLPRTPLVIFLYHPFLAPMLQRVLHNLQTQLQAEPRPAYLLYANPTYPRVMRRFPGFVQVAMWNLPLSPEDAEADRHGTRSERFALYRWG